MSNIGTFVRAAVDELWQRANVFTKVGGEDVYMNGNNNQYPKEVELVINNSPSATLGAQTNEKFLIGQGFDLIGNEIYDTKKGLTLNQIGRSSARTYARQGGIFLLRKFAFEDGVFVPKFIQNLNFSKCRVAKKDDAGYDGVIYYKDWSKRGLFHKKDKDSKWFYPFSNDQKVIKAQLLADAGLESIESTDDIEKMISKQRGQVLFYNSTPEYVYPIAPIDPAYNDADTEYRIGMHANNSARHGFQKKKLFVINSADTEGNKQIQDTLKSMLGLDQTAGFGLIEVENVQKLDDYLLVKELESDFDDKQFEVTDKRVRRNILGCWGVPEGLVATTDNSNFGNSGESYKQMKAFYNQQTQDDRKALADVFRMVLDIEDLEIIPLEDVINEEDGTDTE